MVGELSNGGAYGLDALKDLSAEHALRKLDVELPLESQHHIDA
jgi:hypothetical protein